MCRQIIFGLVTLLMITFFIASCDSLTTIPDYSLTVSVEPSEAGTVTEERDNATANAELVELTAQPNEHWVFVGWAGDHSGNEFKTTLLMSGNKDVTALFQKKDYPLTVTVEGGGQVLEEIISQKSTTNEYPHATMLKLTAEPDYGWEFIEWGGEAEGTDPELEVEIGGPVNITAVFGRVDFELVITIEGGGEVEQEIIQSKVTTDEYPFETMVQLTPIADNGWKYSSWSGEFEGEGPVILVDMQERRELTVTFDRIIYPVSIEISGEGSVQKQVNGEVTNSESFPFETELELVSQPSTGWEIEEWIVNGESVSSDENVTISILGETEIEARFQLIQYDINVNLTGSGSLVRRVNGQVTTQTSYTFGTILQLEAVPQFNWSFAGWTGGIQSTIPVLTIFVDSDLNLNLDFLPFVPNSKILMLGDSITNGFPFTYRYVLNNLMKNNALSFQFVGTQNSNPASYPGSWDMTHEGYNGATTNFHKTELPGWLQQYTADIALIHLGTVDILNYSGDNKSLSELNKSQENLSSIIDLLRGDNPNIKIYLAKILPVASPSIDQGLQNDMISVWHDLVQITANSKNTAQSPIRVVDFFSGFTTTDLYDGVHPARQTSDRMGQIWFDVLTEF